MAALSITTASVLASAQATIRREYTLAATITQGQYCYLNSNNQWALVDSDGGLGTGKNDQRGFSLSSGAINQPAAVVTRDPNYIPGATLTNGITVYAFTTAGAISMADIPTTAGFPVIAGLATSTTTMNVPLNGLASGVVI